MATFLTTPAMNPALRARIERSVSPRARAGHAAKRAGLSPAFTTNMRDGAGRTIAIFAILLVCGLIAAMHYFDARAVESQKSSLLTALEAHRASLPFGHDAFLADTARWAARVANEPAGDDVVAPELLEPGALDAWLARPAVYIRSAAPELADSRRLDEAASTSIKDAFLLCLVEPPATRTEQDLVAKVHGVYFGGTKVDAQTENVRRLLDARVGLRVIDAGFEAQVRGASALGELKKLEKTLAAAASSTAEKAARAELMIIVADEVDSAEAHRSGRGVEPLGYRAQEAPHHARVALIDLASDRVLLRVRRPVDTSELSKRATVHRVAVQSCGLALEARAAAE